MKKNYPYKKPVCRGSFALGTACRHCERCMEQLEKMCIGDSSKYDANDHVTYLQSDDYNLEGVGCLKSNVMFVDCGYNRVNVMDGNIDINDFNEMCIAWLCLYKPSAIADDSMRVALNILNNNK